MQCFSFDTVNGLVRGIEVKEEKFRRDGRETHGFYLGLGQSSNHESQFTKINLDKYTPAAVDNGKIMYAYPFTVKIKETDQRQGYEFVSLQKPKTPNRLCLVRICCKCPEKVIFGYHAQQYGSPWVPAKAWGCDDVNHPDRIWLDDLVVIGDGDAIMVEIQSGSTQNDVRRHVLYNSKGTLAQTSMEAWERIEKEWDEAREALEIKFHTQEASEKRVEVDQSKMSFDDALEARRDQEDIKADMEADLLESMNAGAQWTVDEEDGVVIDEDGIAVHC